jgi:hypothetical protein
VVDVACNLESSRYAEDGRRAELALRNLVPTLESDYLRRLILAQRPASAAATLRWLARRIASGDTLDGLPEAADPPAHFDLVRDVAAATDLNPDELQELVDYVWYHPHSEKQLIRAERINLIRRSVRASFHNPRAVAQVVLDGA